MPCVGSANYQYKQSKWQQTLEADCVGDCPSGTCRQTAPEEILGDAKLEELHGDILDILRAPQEGAEVSTRCACK